FPSKIPVRVLAALADDCPYLLKRAARHRILCDVSYSHLWVDAFPGMAWSQSLREVVEYVASRVRPSATHIAARAYNVKSEAWASRGEWSRLSQSRRILQWITSRPTRPVT